MEEGEKARPCRYIALDIHKYYSVVAGVDRDGEEILSPCRVEHAELESWLAKHLQPTDRVVIESTTNAWHVYDLLEPLVSEVLVANPMKVKQIACARLKTDNRDTLILARLLAAKLVPTVWVPPKHVRELRQFISHRRKLANMHTQVVNRLPWRARSGDAQCGAPPSSQSPERERFPAQEHALATGQIALADGKDAVGAGYGDTCAPGSAK
jgi:transposase